MDLVTLIQKLSGCVTWLFHQPEFHSLKNKLFAMQWVFNRLIKVSFKEYFSSNEFQIILKFIGRPVDHYGFEKF